MPNQTRDLFLALAELVQRFGEISDMEDRGYDELASTTERETRAGIREALAAASAEDRERIALLFGRDAPLANVDWSATSDHLRFLAGCVERLPLPELRDRQRRFLERVERLRADPGAATIRLLLRYRPDLTPTLFDTLHALAGHDREPLGSYCEYPWWYHLNLAGEGYRSHTHWRDDRMVAEDYEASIGGAVMAGLIHQGRPAPDSELAVHAPGPAELGSAVERLRAVLPAHGWEAVSEGQQSVPRIGLE